MTAAPRGALDIAKTVRIAKNARGSATLTLQALRAMTTDGDHDP
jgi:hypothetical protein